MLRYRSQLPRRGRHKLAQGNALGNPLIGIAASFLLRGEKLAHDRPKAAEKKRIERM
jgi:hypothetical protein